MPWEVVIGKKVQKYLAKKLPQLVLCAIKLLFSELEQNGPVRGNWPNSGKLDEKRHHCHLKKGKPTYVAVWEEISPSQGQPASMKKSIEVTYVGTHEKAPY